MAPRLLTLLCLIIALATQPAQARLGDTPEKCKERYGKPEVVKAGAPAELKHIYRVGGMTITTEFIGGKAAVISYRKSKGKPFAPEEIASHMLTNGDGKPWGKASIIPLGRSDRMFRWQGDGCAAHYYEGARLLSFVTSEFVEKKEAADKAKKAKE